MPIVPARHSAAGFTLLEVLIAILLTSILFAAVAQTMHTVLSFSQQDNRRLTANDALESVDRTLRALISEMEVQDDQSPSVQATQRAQSFSLMHEQSIFGTDHSFQFVAPLPKWNDVFPTQRALIMICVDGQNSLVLRWIPWPHVGVLRAPVRPQQIELLPNVAGIAILYRAEFTAPWLAEWHRPEAPAWVRIHITFPQNDKRHWPDIIAAPARAASAL